jgi:hypothetical protein
MTLMFLFYSYLNLWIPHRFFSCAVFGCDFMDRVVFLRCCTAPRGWVLNAHPFFASVRLDNGNTAEHQTSLLRDGSSQAGQGTEKEIVAAFSFG